MTRTNDWLVMHAPGSPWGATIQISKIDSIRIFPDIDDDGNKNGRISVVVDSEKAIQALTYDDLEEAKAEYARLTSAVLGG